MGAADGVTIVLGLLVSLAFRDPGAVARAALGAGTAELVGMTAGAWLSDSHSGFWPALANGTAALAACAVPALPFLFGTGTAALIGATAIIALVGAVITWLRPEKGALAVVQTFGVLVAAAALCYAAGLI